jgi:hypothetical protein
MGEAGTQDSFRWVSLRLHVCQRLKRWARWLARLRPLPLRGPGDQARTILPGSGCFKHEHPEIRALGAKFWLISGSRPRRQFPN